MKASIRSIVGAAIAHLLLFGSVGLGQSLTFDVPLDVSQTVPPPAVGKANPTGHATVTVNTATAEVTVSGSYTNMESDVVGAHFHGPADVGENANAILTLQPTGGNTGTFRGNAILSGTNLRALYEGRTYLSVRTAANGQGSIRGQIENPSFRSFNISLDASQSVPESNVAGASPSGEASVFVDVTNGDVAVVGSYQGMTSGVTGLHLHGPAKAGETAGVIAPLKILSVSSGTSGNISGGMTLEGANLAALFTGHTYINVHTLDNAEGEIRGQIVDSSIRKFEISLDASQAIPAPDLSVVVEGEGDAAEGEADAAAEGEADAAAEGEADAAEGEADAAEGEADAAEGEADAAEGEADAAEGEADAAEGEADAAEGEADAAEGEADAAEGDADAAEGDDQIETVDANPVGSVIVYVDANSGWLSVTGSFEGLTSDVVAAHIHGPAKAGETAGVVLPLNVSGDTTGTITGEGLLQEADLTALFAGHTYINVHTANNAEGEIRGQIADKFVREFNIALDSSQEIPAPVLDDANPAGSASVFVDAITGKFSVTGAYDGMTSDVTAAHIHGPASSGETASAIFPLQVTGGVSGTIKGTGFMSETNMTALFAGNTYINVHTANNGPGEIRGQVIDSFIREFTFMLDASQEIPSPAIEDADPTGSASVTIDTITGKLLVSGSYSGMTSDVAAAHIHGPASTGETAGVLIPLQVSGGTSGTISGATFASEATIPYLLTGYTYVNVHTANNGPGEIRGQVTDDAVRAFVITLDPSQGIPAPVTDDATPAGSASVRVDTLTGNLLVSGAYDGMTSDVVAAHIHGPASVRNTAGVILPLNVSGGISGTINGASVVSNTDMATLLAGHSYINVHTENNSSGEIRGQITDESIREFAITLDPSQAIPSPVIEDAAPVGNASVSIDLVTRTLSVVGTYDGLTSDVVAAHIHGPARVGETAGVLIPLHVSGGTSGTVSGSASLSDSDIPIIFAGLTYVNIHTETNSAGEIRGQITDGSIVEFVVALQSSEVPVSAVVDPAEGDVDPAEGDADPAEGDADPAEGDADPAEGDADPAEGDADPAEGTIAEVAAENGSFGTLLTALTAAGLADTFADPEAGPFTVFAPTDDAFAALPEGTIEAALADPEGLLTEVLTYHVANGAVLAETVVTLPSVVTLNGKEVTIEVVDGGVVLNGSVNVTMTDIEASNGVIHVIDAVLLPPVLGTIAEVAAENGSFGTLLTALTAAGLADTFADPEAGPFTVFAPTDDAFAALPEGTIEAALADPEGLLTEVLTYHVANGAVLAETVVTLPSVVTLNGKEVTIEVIDGGVVLNGSVNVTMTDIEASNGVIHVIDAVLLPPADPVPAGTATLIIDSITGKTYVMGSYDGMTSNVVNAHLHGLARPFDTVGIIFPFTVSGGTAGTFTGSGNLTASDVQGLIDGLTYINVGTESSPDGEIRGQVLAAGGPVPFFPFADDFEDGDVRDDSPVSFVLGQYTSVLELTDGNMVLSKPEMVNGLGLSIGLTSVTWNGRFVHSEDTSAQAEIQVSDQYSYAGIYTRAQFGAPMGDGGAYFGDIRGDGLITAGSFTGEQLILETPLDPVNTVVILQVDTVGAHVITTAWAADDPSAKYSVTFVDSEPRPAGFMGQSFGHVSSDAPNAGGEEWHVALRDEATSYFHSFQVLDSSFVPFVPFTDDFEDGSISDDAPVSHAPGTLPAAIGVSDGDLTLSGPVQLEGFSIGVTNVTLAGKFLHAQDVSAQTGVRVSDALAFAGVFSHGQTTDRGGDGGAYFGNIRGDGLISTGSFNGEQVTLETPLDAVNGDVVLQVDVVGPDVVTTAWAAEDPDTKYMLVFSDAQRRPAGTMGLSFGRDSDDATDAAATFRFFEVLEPILAEEPGEDDAGEGDAGEGDAGEGDAGEGDAGEGDAGEGDAGEGDAGEGDAGEGDAGEGDADPAEGTIAEVAAENGSFGTLLTALTAAGLADTFADPEAGPFTVFAPTDDAFAALPEGTIEAALADPEGLLTEVLTYHVANGAVLAETVVTLPSVVTLNGKEVTIEVVDGGVVLNGSVNVTMTDIEASNGVIHVIDAVLLPPVLGTIAEVAAENGSFGTLLTALTAAGLADTFADPEAGPFTVFAPTDDAFAALPEGTIEAALADPEGLLTEVLTYHVANGAVLAETVVTLPSVVTLNGKEVTIEVVDGGVVLNGSVNVTMTDIEASNGVIHVIDAVLLPPADPVPAGTAN